MTFKPSLWYPIAAVLSAINLVAAGFAMASGEAEHTGVHVALAAAFAFWAQHLRQARQLGVGGEIEPRLEALEFEVSNLRRELGEAQERLDFTERILAQEQEARRLGPER